MKIIKLQSFPKISPFSKMKINPFPARPVKKRGLGNVQQRPMLIKPVKSRVSKKDEKILACNDGGGISKAESELSEKWGHSVKSSKKTKDNLLKKNTSAFKKAAKLSLTGIDKNADLVNMNKLLNKNKSKSRFRISK